MKYFGITECPDEKWKSHSVLKIQQNKFWTRPENKTIFRDDSIIIHLHYTGTTPMADFWPHYFKTAQPRKNPVPQAQKFNCRSVR